MPPQGAMNVNSVVRIVILVISAAVMLIGILAMAGLLVPRYFPDEYRVIIGAVVFLYGLYRFVLAYYRERRKEE
jgi:hypothetical protein